MKSVFINEMKVYSQAGMISDEKMPLQKSLLNSRTRVYVPGWKNMPLKKSCIILSAYCLLKSGWKT